MLLHATTVAPVPVAQPTLLVSPQSSSETLVTPPYEQELVPLREHPPLPVTRVKSYVIDEYIARWLTPPRPLSKLKVASGCAPFSFLEKTHVAFAILRRDAALDRTPLSRDCVLLVPSRVNESASVESGPKISTTVIKKKVRFALGEPPAVDKMFNGVDLKAMDWDSCKQQLATYLIKKEERETLRKETESANTKSQISHQVWTESLASVTRQRVDRDYDKSDADAFKTVRDHAGEALRLRKCVTCKDGNDPALCVIAAVNAYTAILRNSKEGRATKDKALKDATFVMTQAGSRETGLWVGLATSIITCLLDPTPGSLKSSFVQRCCRSIQTGRRFSKIRKLGGPIHEKITELLSKASEDKRAIPENVKKALAEALKPEIDEDSSQWDPCLKLLQGGSRAVTTVSGTFVSWVAPSTDSHVKRSPSTLASQNLNGLRARGAESLLKLMAELGWPDVILFSEVKASWKDIASCPTLLERLRDKGYNNIYLNFSGPGAPNGKGHAGVMAMSKYKPDNVFFGMKGENINDEGRVLTLEFDDFFLVAPYKPANVFTPQGMADRISFEREYSNHVISMTTVTGGKPHISFGDMNVAPLAEDSHPMAMSQVKHKTKDLTYEPGRSPEELKAHADFLKATDCVDAQLTLNPTAQSRFSMTWWPTPGRRSAGHGRRLDLALASASLFKDDSPIRIMSLQTFQHMTFGSDHCPLALVISRSQAASASVSPAPTAKGPEVGSVTKQAEGPISYCFHISDKVSGTIYKIDKEVANTRPQTIMRGGRNCEFNIPVFWDTGNPHFCIVNPREGHTAYTDPRFRDIPVASIDGDVRISGIGGGSVRCDVVKFAPFCCPGQKVKHSINVRCLFLDKHEPNFPPVLMGWPAMNNLFQGFASSKDEEGRPCLTLNIWPDMKLPCLTTPEVGQVMESTNSWFVQNVSAKLVAAPKHSFSSNASPRKPLDNDVAEMLGLLNLRFSEDEGRRNTSHLKAMKPPDGESCRLPASEAFSQGPDNALTGGDLTDDDEDEDEEIDLYQNNPCPTLLTSLSAKVDNELEQGIPCVMLQDTGAVSNLISSRLAARFPDAQRVVRNLPRVKMGDGRIASASSCIALHVNLGSGFSKIVPFLVFDGLPLPAILGTRTMEAWGATLVFRLRLTKLPDFIRHNGTGCPELEVPWRGVRTKPWRAPLPLKASECIAIPPRSMALIPVDSVVHLCIDGAEKGYCTAPREEDPIHNDARGDVLPFQVSRFTKRVQILSGPSNELEGPTHVQATNPTPFTIIIYSGEHVADYHFADYECVTVNPNASCTCGARKCLNTKCVSDTGGLAVSGGAQWSSDTVCKTDTGGLAASGGAQRSPQGHGHWIPLVATGVVATGGESPSCSYLEASQVNCRVTVEDSPEKSLPTNAASRGLGTAALPVVMQYCYAGTPTPNAEESPKRLTPQDLWPTGEAARLLDRDRSCSATSAIRSTILQRGFEEKVGKASQELQHAPDEVPPPDTPLSSNTNSRVSSSNQSKAGISLSSFKNLAVNLTNRIADVLQGRRTIEKEGGGLLIRSTLEEQEFSRTGGGSGSPPIPFTQRISDKILNASVTPTEEVEHGGLATDGGQPLLRAPGSRTVPVSTTSLAAKPIACSLLVSDEATSPDPTWLGCSARGREATASLAAPDIPQCAETVETRVAEAPKLNEAAPGTRASSRPESSTVPTDGTLETNSDQTERADPPPDQKEGTLKSTIDCSDLLNKSFKAHDVPNNAVVQRFKNLMCDFKDDPILKDTDVESLIKQRPLEVACDLLDWLWRRKVCFSDGTLSYNADTVMKHSTTCAIRTTTPDPTFKAYAKNWNPTDQLEIDTQCEAKIEQGILEPSSAPWSSNVVLVRKDGKCRMAVDYRRLNAVTIKDVYPMPKIQALTDSLTGSRFLTCVDMCAAFHQIPMADERSKDLTSFRSPKRGLLRYAYMPFGLTNAGAVWSRFIDETLAQYRYDFCLCYADDVLVYTKSDDVKEHIKHLDQVFDKLELYGIKAKASKVKLGLKELPFLGMIASVDGVKPNPAKVAVIAEMKPPKTIGQLRRVCGQFAYYRKFIKDFASIAAPLYAATGKNKQHKRDSSHSIIFDAAQLKAFETLKKAITESPVVLAYPMWDKPFEIHTDASGEGIGAVLCQIVDGKEHVIMYASRVLSEAERKYHSYESEALAVVWATELFRHYVYGQKFVIRTDCRSLQWLKTRTDSARVMKWVLRLQEFDYEVKYRPGVKSQNVDALTREVTEVDLPGQPDVEGLYLVPETTYTISTRSGSAKPVADPVVSHAPKPPTKPHVAASAPKPPIEAIKLKPGVPRHEPIAKLDFKTAAERQKRKRKRDVFVPGRSKPVKGVSKSTSPNGLSPLPELSEPSSENEELLKDDGDEYLSLDAVSASPGPPFFDCVSDLEGWTPDVWLAEQRNASSKSMASIRKALSERGASSGYKLNDTGLIVMDYVDRNGSKRERVVVPESLRAFVLAINHNLELAGHKSHNKMLDDITPRFFWPGMKNDIVRWVKACSGCRKRKTPRPLRAGNTEAILATGPNQRIAVDLQGPFPETSGGNVWIVTLIDVFDRWLEAVPIPNARVGTIMKVLLQWVCRFGIPLAMLSDKGRNLIARSIKILCLRWGIGKITTGGYNPTGNSVVERAHRYIGAAISILMRREDPDWDEYIPAVLFSMRVSQNSATGFSPFFLRYGYEARLPADCHLQLTPDQYADVDDYVEQTAGRLKEAFQLAREAQADAAWKNAERDERERYEPDFKVGEYLFVWMRSSLESRLPKTMEALGATAEESKKKRKLPSKFVNPWAGPYRVLRKLTDLYYELDFNGTPKKFQVNRLTRSHSWDDLNKDTHEWRSPRQRTSLHRGRSEQDADEEDDDGLVFNKGPLQRKEFVIFKMEMTDEYQVPFGIARVLQVEPTVSLQWFGNRHDRVDGTYRPMWFQPRTKQAYYSINPEHVNHRSYTMEDTQTPLDLADVICRGFGLITGEDRLHPKVKRALLRTPEIADVPVVARALGARL